MSGARPDAGPDALSAFGGRARLDPRITVRGSGLVFPPAAAWLTVPLDLPAGTYALDVDARGGDALRCELETSAGFVPLPLPATPSLRIVFATDEPVATLRLMPQSAGTVRFERFAVTPAARWRSLLPDWQLGPVKLPHRQGDGALEVPPARPEGWNGGVAIVATERCTIRGARFACGPSGAVELCFDPPLPPGRYRFRASCHLASGAPALVEPRLYAQGTPANGWPLGYLRPTGGAVHETVVTLSAPTRTLVLQPRAERGEVVLEGLSWERLSQIGIAVFLSRQAGARLGHPHRREDEALLAGPAEPVPPPHADRPSVSLITPTKDAAQHLFRFLESLARTDYRGVELVLVDNGSRDEHACALLEDAASRGAVVVADDRPFNFSALVNEGAKHATGAVLVLANNDLEFCDPHWLNALVDALGREDVAIAGGWLDYPHRRVQHAGLALDGEARVRHLARGAPARRLRSRALARHVIPVSAVTGALMAVTRAHFDALGGLRAGRYPVLYNDVDFCLRAWEEGGRSVLVPAARAIHHESVSFGPRTPTLFGRGGPVWRMERAAEADRFRQDWSNLLDSDPWYPEAYDRMNAR